MQASHCDSKQQCRSLYYCLFAPHISGCYSSRTSRSWWTTHSTQRHPRDCNSQASRKKFTSGYYYMPLLSCKFILLYGRYFNCVNKVVGSVFSVADGALFVQAIQWIDSSRLVISLWLCSKHKELNEKVKHDLFIQRAERVGDLVQVRTTYGAICWFHVW